MTIEDQYKLIREIDKRCDEARGRRDFEIFEALVSLRAWVLAQPLSDSVPEVAAKKVWWKRKH